MELISKESFNQNFGIYYGIYLYGTKVFKQKKILTSKICLPCHDEYICKTRIADMNNCPKCHKILQNKYITESEINLKLPQIVKEKTNSQFISIYQLFGIENKQMQNKDIYIPNPTLSTDYGFYIKQDFRNIYSLKDYQPNLIQFTINMKKELEYLHSLYSDLQIEIGLIIL